MSPQSRQARGNGRCRAAAALNPAGAATERKIFYEGPTGVLTAVPVSTESGFSTGTLVSLFQVQGRFQISFTDIFTYDATKDGQRFLVNRYVKPDSAAPITIVLNATASQL